MGPSGVINRNIITYFIVILNPSIEDLFKRTYNKTMEHKVSQHQLTGGAKLLAIQIPNTITFYWGSFFRPGFRHVDKDKYELPHLAEHLAFAGTKTYPTPDSFKSEVEKDGTYYNAFTSTDYVWYEFVGASSEVKRIINLNLSQIFEPLYHQERIEQEIAVITQELSRNKENDSWRLSQNDWGNILAHYTDVDHRIAKLAEITKSDIKKYHNERYSVSGTSFVLAGNYTDQELEDIIDLLNKRLGKVPTGNEPSLKPVEFKNYGGKVFGYEPYSDRQSMFALRFTGKGKDEENDPALRIMSTILTGGLMGRLHRKARESGLTYGIGSAGSTSPDYTSFAVGAQTSVDKLKPLIELSCIEITAIGEGEYGDDELERAIGYKVGGYLRSMQTPAQFANWYYDDFIQGDRLIGVEEEVERIRSVTRQDIKRAYDKYFNRGNITLNIIGKGFSKSTDEYDSLIKNYFN